MKQENMSQWGKEYQNGWKVGRSPCVSNCDVIFPSSFRRSIRFVCSASRAVNRRCSPNSSRPTRHFGQRLFLQQATRTCSGWSAMYAAMMGNTSLFRPSAQTILTPFSPAEMSGFKMRFMQSWYSCQLAFDRASSSSITSSPSEGMYPTKTVVFKDGFRRISLEMLPMER